MILSASYNFYNGEEHLKASLQSIRNQVDYITIVYQKQSNAGNPISDEALTILHDAKKEKLCDKLIEFTPNLNKARQENELEKRRIGLQAALWRLLYSIYRSNTLTEAYTQNCNK